MSRAKNKSQVENDQTGKCKNCKDCQFVLYVSGRVLYRKCKKCGETINLDTLVITTRGADMRNEHSLETTV